MWRHVVFWVGANFVGVTLEAFGDHMCNMPQFRRFEVRFVGSALFRLKVIALRVHTSELPAIWDHTVLPAT